MNGEGPFELGTDGPSVILVGVDESVTAWRAASYSFGLARRQGADVVAVYVAPFSGAGAVGSAGAAIVVAESEAHEEIAAELAERAEAAVRELGISVRFLTMKGDPYHEIVRVAEETRADAIVVGASLKAGHRLMGSLAIRLVRAGRWPVTVVP